MSWCLPHLLQKQAQRTPDAVVFVSPGRAPLTYGRLWQHTVETVQTLSVLGVSPHDRIALVLPNGPEMAVAFLAVATSMTCVPLNPAYSAPEYDRYLADVGVKVLIVQAGMDSPARDVAPAHGLPIIELSPLHEAEAGLFALQGETQAHTRVHAWAQPDDVALLLLTSGTMSRPKIVRLTQNNICTAAYNMHVFLHMTAGDRCLNVVPFFHIYGLVGIILTSLMAGASVVCTPGFDAAPFFAWMEAFRPTWYAGVPAMHHALLSYVAQHRETVVPCRLRFIRSGGALLSPQVLAELENLFQAPVLVSYGMTEASAQITCNPLPPRPRKLGSVGVAAGPKVAIMDAMGSILPVGTMGEIVIRGASVTPGYDNDLTTTRQAFTHG